MAASCRLTFQLPSDLQAVYRTFKIDLPTYNGDDSWTLPMPARYVIDTGGQIRSAHVHADYTRRPEPEEALVAVTAIADPG